MTPYKRASRKGAPKRFACGHPDCGKVYSRAEHLQRHQLNHNAQVFYRCQVVDCNQEFVRKDLLERHVKRHSASYVPRNRTSSFTSQRKASQPDVQMANAQSASPTVGTASQGQTQQPPLAPFQPPSQSAPRNASILLTSESDPPRPSLPSGPAAWTPVIEGMNVIRPKPGFYGREPAVVHGQSQASFIPFAAVPVLDVGDLARDNFAMWLFDPQRNYADFNMANMPFFEGGLESPFNNNIHYDHESLTSQSQMDLTPPMQPDTPDELMTEYRRQEVLRWVQIFRNKQARYEPLIAGLMQESRGDFPGLSLELMRDCVRHYWDHLSARLPIVHQPTFSSNHCSVFLLMVIIALGAKSLHNLDTSGVYKEHGHFADLIITCVRWEILTAEEASPPVDLWVSQALLLLEFYEKMLSTRKLHERAHIYHSATLTLLRRGSPLIGRSGSESPPDPTTRENSTGNDARSWWSRWAETEAMYRVVFAAFMMDVVHAAMFGHTADMAPSEIHLPLPCDESLWSASTPESVRQQEANFRMYGVKPVSFLDGLKSAMHGKEVQTHSFGRMTIMCGLLSVGWHLSRRETHLKWLELPSPSSDRLGEKWCNMLLKAYDHWKTSFDSAMGTNDSECDAQGHQSGSNGLVQSAAVLYHLAHISLYVDIVDCQVYAGAKRLLSRKISTRDYTRVVNRMRKWATQGSTRHAILHAFKLLHRVLVEPKQKKIPVYQNGSPRIQYSCLHDPDPHRPWIMYYATLSIWAFVQALGRARSPSAQMYSRPLRRSESVAEYLSRVARLTELDTGTAATLNVGLPELLDVVANLAAEAHSELLLEARSRLGQCKELLAASAA